MQSQMAPGTPSLKPLCPTQWIVQTAAIDSVVNNYAVLQDVLTEINREGKDEYAAKAGGYLNQMDNFYVYFGRKLSHLLFSTTKQLSVPLQGKDTTIHKAIHASNLALKFLESQRTGHGNAYETFYKHILDCSKDLTDDLTLPRYRKQPRRYNGHASHKFESPETYFKHAALL